MKVELLIESHEIRLKETQMNFRLKMHKILQLIWFHAKDFHTYNKIS